MHLLINQRVWIGFNAELYVNKSDIDVPAVLLHHPIEYTDSVLAQMKDDAS